MRLPPGTAYSCVYTLEFPARLYGLVGRRRQRRRYQLARGRRRERPNEARRYPRLRVPVLVIQIIGVFVGVHRLDFRRVPVFPPRLNSNVPMRS